MFTLICVWLDMCDSKIFADMIFLSLLIFWLSLYTTRGSISCPKSCMFFWLSHVGKSIWNLNDQIILVLLNLNALFSWINHYLNWARCTFPHDSKILNPWCQWGKRMIFLFSMLVLSMQLQNSGQIVEIASQLNTWQPLNIHTFQDWTSETTLEFWEHWVLAQRCDYIQGYSSWK